MPASGFARSWCRSSANSSSSVKPAALFQKARSARFGTPAFAPAALFQKAHFARFGAFLLPGSALQASPEASFQAAAVCCSPLLLECSSRVPAFSSFCRKSYQKYSLILPSRCKLTRFSLPEMRLCADDVGGRFHIFIAGVVYGSAVVSAFDFLVDIVRVHAAEYGGLNGCHGVGIGNAAAGFCVGSGISISGISSPGISARTPPSA